MTAEIPESPLIASGMMKWGQDGRYSAREDRDVITALTAGNTGIVRAAGFTPAGGMLVTVDAGWIAVADCQDGSHSVISATQPGLLAVPASDTAGTITYDVFAELQVDQGTWVLVLLGPGDQDPARPGISLGTIMVPDGAESASDLILDPAPVTFTAGALGPQGVQGPPGPPGPQGESGPQGEPGIEDLSPWPRGIVAWRVQIGGSSAAQSSPNTSPIFCSCMLTTVTGRLYRVRAFTGSACTSDPAASLWCQLYCSAPEFSGGNMGPEMWFLPPAGGNLRAAWAEYAGPVSPGQWTFGVRFWTDQGRTAFTDFQNRGLALTIEDCGAYLPPQGDGHWPGLGAAGDHNPHIGDGQHQGEEDEQQHTGWRERIRPGSTCQHGHGA